MFGSLLVSVLLATSPDPARAEPSRSAPNASARAEQGRSATRSSRAKSRVRVIRLDAIKVEGRIQKPQAFYILQRSALSFDALQRTERLSDKIDQAVTKEPF